MGSHACRWLPVEIALMARHVVIVSPYFPPAQLAGVHRARHLAKHLPAAGWTPIVLCVDERFHEQRLDPDLARLVPPETEIIKVPAIPVRWTRPLGLGDITLRAWSTLRSGLVELGRRRTIDAVFITAAPYYHLLLAPMIRRQLGIPVVVDFQDPWVSHWGTAQPRWSKAGLSHRLASMLEPRVLRVADWVTTVSERQNAEMTQRYPWLDPKKMSALPIGGDAEDFAAAATLTAASENARARKPIEFSYVGSYWPAVEPSIRIFMRGLSVLRQRQPELARRLRVNFIGTDSTAMGNRHSVLPIAEQEGVDEIVSELPQRQPYLQALAAMKASDGLLLIGSNEPHYTASKIYSALMSQRPYLSLFRADSSAHSILTEAGGGIAVSFTSGADLQTKEGALADALIDLATRPEALGKADPRAFAPYQASRIAEGFARIFDRVIVDARRTIPAAASMAYCDQ